MTDSEIIELVLKGNASKYELLINKYKQQVFRTTLGFTHSREDSEDLVQEIFLKVFQKLSSFKNNSLFSTWLYRIAVNSSLNYISKKRMVFDSMPTFFQPQTKDRNPQQVLEYSETELQIQRAIDSLTEKQKTAFILSKYDDLSLQEIAKVMSLTEGAVEQHLHRAKQALQKKLAHLKNK